jgi:hypothetical protein
VLLQVEAEVEERFAQNSGMAQQQGDEQAADAPIAVEERMAIAGFVSVE